MLLKPHLQRAIRTAGWDLHRAEIDRSIDTFLPRIFSQLGVNCVLDVGARNGEFGSSLRRMGYRGRIVSFEPIRQNCAVLTNTIGQDRKWHALPLALGRTEDRQEINVMSSSNFSSFLSPSDYGSDFEGNDVALREKVEIRDLDSLMPRLIAGICRPCVYLKLDTQGWDLEVIAGATNSLQHVVACQSEMSLQPLYDGMPSYAEALDRFHSLGFVPSAMFPVLRDAELRLVEFDCVMVRR